MKKPFYSLTKKIGLLAGPILFLVLLAFPAASHLSNEANKVIAVAALMIIWWITEAIPIAATALIPIVLFPFLGVFSIKEATSQYSSPIIFLFMGGLIIALAMEKWNLHKRIALSIIKLTGTSANRIVLGFMLSTAILSMWISNTATTVMMLPIATSVLSIFIRDTGTLTQNEQRFALALFLGIAYSANVGGIATLVGTPPNVVFSGFMESAYAKEIPFTQWLTIGIPYSTILLAIIYFVLVKWVYPNHLGELSSSKDVIHTEYEKLGKITRQEVMIAIIFLLTALSWIFRKPMQELLPEDIVLNDTIIAIFFALVVFFLPYDFKKGKFLLQWEDTKKLPWGILILFGGGLSLANAMKETGIVDFVGQLISSIGSSGTLVVVTLIIVMVIFMTELMSNVALITILLPIVGGIATGLGIDPIIICICITIASSCAFMLPMATPPNAIIFASGHVKIAQMVRAGILLNIIAILLLLLFYKTLIPYVF